MKYGSSAASVRSSAPPSVATVSRAGLDHRRALGGVGEPGADPDRELADVGDLLGPARGVEGGIDFREIPDMRPVQDGGAELDRLDRILAAVARQRAADEDDRRQPIDQAELAQRVDDVDVVRGLRQSPLRAQHRRKPAGVRDLDDAGPAIGVARRDDREQPWKTIAQPPVRVDQRGLLPGVGRRGRDGGAIADGGLQGLPGSRHRRTPPARRA